MKKSKTCDKWGHVVRPAVTPIRAAVYSLAFAVFLFLSVVVTWEIIGELVKVCQEANDPQKAADSFMIAFMAFVFGVGALLSIW